MASSKEAATDTKEFNAALEKAGESGGNISKAIKNCETASANLVKALEKIEAEVGKGKPSKEQLKAMADAADDWSDATAGVALKLDLIQTQAAAALKARNAALKALRQ